MPEKPKHLSNEYALQFCDGSVVEAYVHRPPYPSQVFEELRALMRDAAHGVVLDLGCGTGDIARMLSPGVRRVDAVDQSAAMLKKARSLPGGDNANIQWIHSSAEAFTIREPYSLIVAAESFHWMDWYALAPKLKAALAPDGVMALVIDRKYIDVPWQAELLPLIHRYSTNSDFRPYDLMRELQERGLFTFTGGCDTRPVEFRQSVDAYVESFHSRNGFSSERMGAAAEEFDRKLKELLAQHAAAQTLTFMMSVSMAWGRPN